MPSARLAPLFAPALAALLTGCASTPPPQTGFISDYSRLEEVNKRHVRYLAPELSGYHSFIVDPVKILFEDEKGKFSKEDRDEIADYMRNAFIKVLRENGYQIATAPGEGVGRLRSAITDAKKAIAVLNVHPGTKLTGAGRGGASMELEIVDSLTGAQLGASVRADKGNQFELDTFNRLDDVMDVIDDWAEESAADLRSLKASGGES